MKEMRDKNQLTSSQEKYIRAIYHIIAEKQAARVKDIAKSLKIGPSSVSEALKNLAEKEVINYEPYGIITLTTSGRAIAENLEQRHLTICNFLENVLQVQELEVEKNASKIEYEVSNEVLTKFVRFLDFMQTCSCKEPRWIKSFKHYSVDGILQENCQKCIEKNKKDPMSKCNDGCCGKDKP